VNRSDTLPRAEAADFPLCVDLDGTLVKSDLLVESFFVLLRQAPLAILLMPFWLLRGKAYLKEQIARRVQLDVTVLPYHAEFLAYLRQAHAAGRRLVLATASHLHFAEQVAVYLGIFQAVMATVAGHNLSRSRKGERLVAAYGKRGFDYAGNSRADLAVWSLARAALVVNPALGVERAARALLPVTAVFDDRRGGWKVYLEALRLRQWLKNVLLFVPLLAAHRYHEFDPLAQGVLAFLAFGLCASSVYLLNDLLDLPADRHHPRKRHRPFAAGTLSVVHGAALVPALLGAAFIVAAWLPLTYLEVLTGYYLLTLTYSVHLKQVVMLDVLTLAGLYVVRLIAGGAAVGVPLSFWLLALSLFLFLSLALVKRYAELLDLRRSGNDEAQGRGYHVEDLALLRAMGAASGYLAVLVLALYVNSPEVRILYHYPEVIWLLCPLVLYWVSRVWIMAHRGEMHDDPVVFALRDRHSQRLVLIGALILWAAL
jgi:4-hydroxybenzoate polyprenyltransferase